MKKIKGINRTFILKRWVIISIAVIIGLASAGISYARLNDKDILELQDYYPIATAVCSDPFIWVASNDDGSEDDRNGYSPIDPGDNLVGVSYSYWGDSSSGNDPSEQQQEGAPCARYNKDVAKTEAWIHGELDEFITVEINNAYPSYYSTVFFALACPELSQGTITGIVLEGVPPQLSVDYGGISIGQTIPAGGEVSGAIYTHVEQSAEQNATYTFTMSITTECRERVTGTAFAYYNEEYSTCFISMDPKFPWGWTNGPLGPGSYMMDIWLGAAACDFSKGQLAGWMSVDYDGSMAVVTYNMYEGFDMDETQLYVGNGILPLNRKGTLTVSPGQFPYKHSFNGPATTDTYLVTGLSGDIYVVAHAVVGYYE